MKKAITIFIIIFICFNNMANAQAPNWAWAKSIGGVNMPLGCNVITDSIGNVYMEGDFEIPTISIGNTTLTNADTSGTTTDMFIVKYDANGNLIWVKDFGGSLTDLCKGISIDKYENILMIGEFHSPTINFGATTLTNSDTSGRNSEICIVKLDTNGNVLWAKSAVGTWHDHVEGVSTDTIGNIFITGEFYSNHITFGTISLYSSGSGDVFIAKYDSSGNVLWAKNSGNSDPSIARGIAVDNSGNAVITGYFLSPTLTFGSTTLINVGYQNIFIVKYDISGNVLWAKCAVGGLVEDSGFDVTNDTNGNIYVIGSTTSPSISFGNITLTNAVSSGSYNDLIIVKYDSIGNVKWAKIWGGVGDEIGLGISIDASGDIFMTGGFSSPSIPFGSSVLSPGSTLSHDIFIAKLDSNGTPLWAKGFGGLDNDIGLSVYNNNSGNLYISGRFNSSSITVGSTTLVNGYIAPFFNATFIAKLDATSVGLDEFTSHSNISISPNPFSSQTTITFKDDQKNTMIKISDVLGNEIKTSNFSGKQFVIEKESMKAGIYFVQSIDQNKNVMNRKIVVQ